MRVSELVTIDQIKSWNNGDIVTIKAGTGAGKSYFIKNNLYALAKKENTKILFLIHRTNCVNQFKEEIISAGKQDTIHVKTYQFIEAVIKKHDNINLSQYKYIVCDEFHYFMSDAAYNKTTDISLNYILNQSDKIRLFMSATGDYVKKYLTNYKDIHTIDYELPIDYSFIKELTFYSKDSTLDMFMEHAIKNKQKTIFFIESAKKAYEFYSKYKEYSLFNCSKSNKDYYKFVDPDKINSMLINEKFNELILITTTALDTGVNIIDKELKHIVCDIKDIGTIIQSIGRKRLSKNDNELYVYIKSLSNQQLGGIETQLKKKITMAKYLKDHSPEQYVNKYKRELDYSHIVYDDVSNDGTITKKINFLMYYKCIVDMAEITIMKNFGQYGFNKAVSKKLGKEGEYRLIEEHVKENDLEEYIESILGQKLNKQNQNELINKIDLKVNGRIQKSYTKLNEGLSMIKLPYVILPKKSGNERYWIVEKIDK